MAKRHTTIDDFRKAIQGRLSAAPGALSLHARIDEEPEDAVIAWGMSEDRDLVARALDDLISEYFRNGDLHPATDVNVFLQRALRVCDFLQNTRFKATLKLILLSDDYDTWGRQALDELKSLAARALLGLPKKPEDLHFWREIAEQSRLALPYALRATLEIDLQEGCNLFWRMYLQPTLRGENPYVEWPSVLDAVDELYGSGENVAAALERGFVLATDSHDPFAYEAVVLKELRAKRYSRIGRRTFTELGIDYAKPTILPAAGTELYDRIRISIPAKPSVLDQSDSEVAAAVAAPHIRAGATSWYTSPGTRLH